MPKRDYSGAERRKYIRLDTVFPARFHMTDTKGKEYFSEWQQGFTSNIGSGGICLEVNNLSPEAPVPPMPFLLFITTTLCNLVNET